MAGSKYAITGGLSASSTLADDYREASEDDELLVPGSTVIATPISTESLCRGNMTFIKYIASGGMSRISLYNFEKDGRVVEVVVKSLAQKSVTGRDWKYLETEVDILRRVDHRNIIRTYGIRKIGVECGLVLEYFPNGSYTDFFSRFWEIAGKTKVVEDDISPLKIRIIGEVISAMEYLHIPRKLSPPSKEKSILHLDLKGENVLLDQCLQAKICDFGLSMMSTLTKLQSSTTMHGGISGTPGFIAPERLKNAMCKPNTKCDVYSFGILEYTILTDLPPYPGHMTRNPLLIHHHIVEKNLRPDVFKISHIFPLDLKTMMQNCWSARPIDRPSFKELAESMDTISTNLGDFKNKCTGSVNRVWSILRKESPMATNEILPDLRSFSTRTNTRDNVSSAHTSAISSLLPVTHGGWESTADSIGTSTSPHNVVVNDSRSSSYLHGQSNTAPKRPVSEQERRHPDSDDGSDSRVSQPNSTRPFLPPSYESIGSTVPLCSVTKVLLSIAAFVIFAAVIAIAVAIPLSQNSSHAGGGICPTVKKPNHGNVTCEKETKMSTARCHFTCDDGYQIFGSDTILCTGGKWTSGEPSCVKACKLPKVDFGIVKCSNQTFEHSTCSISCTNHHVLQVGYPAYIVFLPDSHFIRLRPSS